MSGENIYNSEDDAIYYPWSDNYDYGSIDDDEGDFVDYLNKKYNWDEGSYSCNYEEY